MDNTETIRRAEVAQINSEVAGDKDFERIRLEVKYGQVWDTAEMTREFNVIGFGASYIVVHRKSDSIRGSLEFQHRPRLYFNFKAE